MEGETSVIESRVHRSNYKQRIPRFFLFVNFSPALYYLNAWNRLHDLQVLVLEIFHFVF